MTQSPQHDPATGTPGTSNSLRLEILNDINKLRRRSLTGAWALLLFLLISVFAWWRFPLLPLPETLTAHLGNPPTPPIISIVFLAYTFFAIILSLSRMMTGIVHNGVFSHLFYLAGFFFFYHATGALDDNFWAVFSAGVTILGADGYRVRQRCLEEIFHNQERLAYLEKTGRLPPNE